MLTVLQQRDTVRTPSASTVRHAIGVAY